LQLFSRLLLILTKERDKGFLLLLQVAGKLNRYLNNIRLINK